MSLSVIIITKNEAANIRACLDSVTFATERIVVDCGSSDDTVAIARGAGAIVIETADWPGFGPQKNRALRAATAEWVLSLDADERVTEPLRDEVLAAVQKPAYDGYVIPRLTSFYGHLIRHSGWYPNYSLRLFRRIAGRFSNDLVHERVVLDRPPYGHLRTPLVHYSYVDPNDYLRKLAQYSTLGAEQAFAAGRRSGLANALLHALSAFLRSYISRRGILDGRQGVMAAILAAESIYHKYFKLMLLTEAAKARRKGA
jgi:glycosyltransferase involved in cell wall biosynthesis